MGVIKVAPYLGGALKYVSKCVALIARLAIFLSFWVELPIFQLESVKAKGTLISGPDLIEKIEEKKNSWKDEERKIEVLRKTYVCTLNFGLHESS